MGTIINSKIRPDNKVKIKISLDEQEALSLKGYRRKIRIFSSEIDRIETKLIERGKDGVTKYFKTPPKFKNRIKRPIFDIKCQRIESNNKIMFVYTTNHSKDLLFNF